MFLLIATLLGWLLPVCAAGDAARIDARSLRIPNRHSVAIIVLYLLAFCLAPATVPPVLSALAAAGIVLLAGLVLFALRIWGAGDAKLAASLSLYMGLTQVEHFILGVALTGGALALIMRVTRRAAETPADDMPQTGRIFIPYGVALAVPFIAMLTQRFGGAYDFLTHR